MTSGEKSGFLASTFTDLMASLAVIFILLAVVFIRESSQRSRRDKEEIKTGLSELLAKNKLPLKQDPANPMIMGVMMGENVLKFPVNSSVLSGAGLQFLDRFIPDLLANLCSPGNRGRVDGLVIEGHTDRSGESTPEGMRRNIKLSQQRSFSVLEKAIQSVRTNPELSECLLALTSATGRGSRDPAEPDGHYDADQSRRVEIKIRVKQAGLAK